MKTIKQQKNKMSNLKKNHNGFTLIELMVATSIFVVVMLLSMSSLLVLINESKNSRTLRSAIDNVNFSMESITRSIRMGKNYYCGGTMSVGVNETNDLPPSGCTSISFIPQGGTSRVGYRSNIITVNGVSVNTIEKCDTSSCVPIVSPDVNIERLKFFVKGSAFDNTQASVYIIIKGTVLIKNLPTSFSLQTMASQRNF
jgi:prepilin-type N-terminal cleavage/methylation domain-containing protein